MKASICLVPESSHVCAVTMHLQLSKTSLQFSPHPGDMGRYHQPT